MFERFTDEARRAVVRTLAEARQLGHDYVGTEHTLIALTTGDDQAASRALVATGVHADRARAATAALTTSIRSSSSWGDGPYTARARHTFELAMHEAIALGHHYVGCGHVLLGMLRLEDCTGIQVLNHLGVDRDVLRKDVVEQLQIEGPPQPPRDQQPGIGVGRLGISTHAAVAKQDEIPTTATVDGTEAESQACSFCQRSLKPGDHFVASAEAAICDGCVTACSRLLHGESTQNGTAATATNDPAVAELAETVRLVFGLIARRHAEIR